MTEVGPRHFVAMVAGLVLAVSVALALLVVEVFVLSNRNNGNIVTNTQAAAQQRSTQVYACALIERIAVERHIALPSPGHC